MIVSARLNLKPVPGQVWQPEDLVFDGSTWSGKNWPEPLLKILNSATPELRQHYTAYDLAGEVLERLYPGQFTLEVTKQDMRPRLHPGAID